jgi:hypothetical protein
VRDNFDAPTINQIIAADYSTVENVQSNAAFDVTVLALTRDTEYDTYCFARDRGTENGAVSPNPGNDISFAAVLATKRDKHTVGDSTAPFLPEPPQTSGFTPLQSASGVGIQETFVFTFSEDVTTSSSVQSSPGSHFIKFYDIDGSGANDKQIDFNDLGTTDGTITIINNVLTVTWANTYNLYAANNYDVVIDPGDLVDINNNAFPGLGGSSRNTDPNKQVYTFTTA